MTARGEGPCRCHLHPCSLLGTSYCRICKDMHARVRRHNKRAHGRGMFASCQTAHTYTHSAHTYIAPMHTYTNVRTYTHTKERRTQTFSSTHACSNVYDYRYTFMVDIVPLCTDDIVCLPKKVANTLGCISQVRVILRPSLPSDKNFQLEVNQN